MGGTDCCDDLGWKAGGSLYFTYTFIPKPLALIASVRTVARIRISRYERLRDTRVVTLVFFLLFLLIQFLQNANRKKGYLGTTHRTVQQDPPYAHR